MIKISFPHIGNYYVAINYLVTKLTKQEVIIPPKITRKTIDIGSKYSPDFVCVPFKYNLGNYIEALNKGANILLQAGGGCRYGYYAELQEQILKDLGYNFEFVNFMQDNRISLKKIYKFAKKLNKKLNIFTYSYYLLNTIIIILIIDKYEEYLRLNMGFEVKEGTHEKIHQELLEDLKKTKSLIQLIKINYKYKNKFNSIEINKPDNCLKVG